MRKKGFKILKFNATERLAASQNQKRVVLVYTGIITLLAALVTVVCYALKLQISQTGGLSNMGLRTILSTIQSVLPMVQNLVVMCLDLGYVAAMVRVSREQYVSERTLTLGFDRFWVMLRYTLIQACIYMTACMAAFWVAMQIWLLTPLSNAVMGMVTPEMADPNVVMELLQDPVFASQITTAMMPLLLLVGVLYIIFLTPISYSMRMTKYVIIDKPGQGALYALKESKKMMKGNCLRLFKLDISLLWWYAIGFCSTLLCYGDVLLPMVGIQLPWSETVSYFLFYALFLILQFVSCYFLRNRIEVIYAQVYNALKPREKDAGVVLGNIFQM